MSRKKLHNVGDEIFAKWPGSDRYYSSVVVGRYDKSNDSYSVKFEDDGDPIDILAKHITVYFVSFLITILHCYSSCLPSLVKKSMFDVLSCIQALQRFRVTVDSTKNTVFVTSHWRH